MNQGKLDCTFHVSLTVPLHLELREAMTSIVDSEAHLLKGSQDMGMSARAVQVLTGGNLNTLGKLAFSIGQPGHPLNSDEFDRYA